MINKKYDLIQCFEMDQSDSFTVISKYKTVVVDTL